MLKLEQFISSLLTF